MSGAIDGERFGAWLDAYGRAWETRDADAAVRLFSEEVVYEETPFSEPARGRDGLHAYWSQVPSHQENIRFEYEILAAGDGRGIALWRATYDRIAGGDRVTLDGVLVADFDGDGRCSRFREWWHSDVPAAF